MDLGFFLGMFFVVELFIVDLNKLMFDSMVSDEFLMVDV